MSLTADGPSPAAATSSLCGICHSNASQYTCPRCLIKTCSAACSSSHKASMSCSGVRDKAAYVPMNSYGWGTMMDDYVFLEDIGRAVEAQGSLIARGGFARGAHGRGRGRGSTTRHGNSTAGRSKREILQMQLNVRNIKMDLLPDGMQRQRSNQSRFDSRDNTFTLTCEIVLYAPTAPRSQTPESDSFKFLTQQNPGTSTLKDVICKGLRKVAADSSKESVKNNAPAWIDWYTRAFNEAPPQVTGGEQNPEDDEPASVLPSLKSIRTLLPEYPPRPLRRPQPNLGIFTPQATSQSHTLRAYHPIVVDADLLECLSHKGFLEYPTFVLVPDSNDLANQSIVLVEDVLEDGTVLHDRKRRRVEPPQVASTSPAGPAKPVGNMLGDYSSEEEAEDEPTAAVGVLGGYESDPSEEEEGSNLALHGGAKHARDSDSDDRDGVDHDGLGGDADSRSSNPSASNPKDPLDSWWLAKAREGDEEAVDWGEEAEQEEQVE
ncbi:hypothetical protein DL93DRAFT_2086448 [Clavulina sp. PMI_390]|nr:hypothetical protein DL93DRAFT_2086448 [Clavulina sp. PMI_390]